MARLHEPRLERFARLLAKEVSVNEAYGKCIAAPNAPRDTITGNSWAFFKKHEAVVVARKLEIQARNARIAEKNEEFTEAKGIAWLLKAIKQKPSEVGPDSPVCEIRMSKTGPYYATIDKMGAFKQLAAMCGWNAAIKVEGDFEVHVSSWIQKIRQGGGSLEQAKVIECETLSQPSDEVDFSCD